MNHKGHIPTTTAILARDVAPGKITVTVEHCECAGNVETAAKKKVRSVLLPGMTYVPVKVDAQEPAMLDAGSYRITKIFFEKKA